MKRIVIVLAAVLFASSSSGLGQYRLNESAASLSDPEVVETATPDWIFMVYLGADNSLSDAGVDDINEMEVAGSTGDVKIVVLHDRPQGNTLIYEIERESPSTDSVISPIVRDYGNNVNSGDLNTLEQFIIYVEQNYPAQHYCLILWDHGDAWRGEAASLPVKGIIYDDTSHDHLTMVELKNALSSAGVHFDIIGFDACLMGAVEVDYQVKDYGDYIVGSEETIYWDGWPYDTILTDLTSEPSISSEALAGAMVTRYAESYQKRYSDPKATLSAVRASSLNALVTAVDGFARELIDNLAVHRSGIEAAGDNTEYYAIKELIDLYHFAELVKQNVSHQDVINSADSVMNALNDAVTAEWHADDHPDSHGMTIYFPDQSDWNGNSSVYSTLDFSEATQWDEFLVMFLTRLSIIFPTQSDPANAGPKDGPRGISVELLVGIPPNNDISGLDADDFNVQIGGRSADILGATELSDKYLLDVLPPRQDEYGSYDLTINMGQFSSTAVEAIRYSESTNIDAVLVIDRSASMGDYGYMEPAKNAAKQFVGLMNEEDQIGVISFSDDAIIDFPLIPITSGPSRKTVIFSDDMENGTQNWVSDPPWAQITNDYHSPNTCWTDSPGGHYSDYTNVSLTSTDIDIPSDGHAFLSFWHCYEIESGYDYGRVEISTDGGLTWSTLASYTGDQGSWIQVAANLALYVGETVRVRFRLDTDDSVTKDGWYIDDVEIKAGISNVKESVKQAIDSISAGGGTSIGDGLEAGREQLVSYGDLDHVWAMILLSDGFETSPDYAANVLPDISGRIDVYTIALGSYADEELLQTIATATGGQYYFSPTTPQILEVYSLIRGNVFGEEIIASETDTIDEGETHTKIAQIDPTVTRATFGVSWPGSNLDLILTDPSGTIIDPNTAATDPNVSFVSGSTYEHYIVTTPSSGEWNMSIQGVSISLGGEDYAAIVTAQTVLSLDAYFEYETTESITVLAALSDLLGPISGADIEIVVQVPQQSLSEWKDVGGKKGDKVPTTSLRQPISVLKSSRSADVFSLYDDGDHGDGQANDGVYGNIYSDTYSIGSYIFSFEASGLTNDGNPFTRVAQRSVFVAEARQSLSPPTSVIAFSEDNFITVAWDSIAYPNIAGYKVYYGTSSDDLSNVVDVGSRRNDVMGARSIVTCELTGLNNSLTYFIAVTAYKDQENESSYSEQISVSPGTDTVELSTGWNMIALPRLPLSVYQAGGITDNLSSVLTSIDGQFDSIWTYDSSGKTWSRYVAMGPDFLNNLTGLIPNQGYWIKMKDAADLEIGGATLGQADIDLESGWNLIGYSLEEPLPLNNILSWFAEGYLESIWTYDSSMESWLRYIETSPGFLNNLTELRTANAYWTHALQNFVMPLEVTPISAAPQPLPSVVGSPTPRNSEMDGSLSSLAPSPPRSLAFSQVANIKIPPAQIPPVVVYGTVERNGEILRKGDNCLISAKMAGKTVASGRIGPEEGHEEFYVLEIPIYLNSASQGGKAAIFADGEEVARIQIDKPGEIREIDISYNEMPRFSDLLQNYPNPFNPDTWIPYQLVEDADVNIRIYNVVGQLVRALHLGHKSTGFYVSKHRSAYWDGKNEAGEEISSGVYFYTIQAGKYVATRKMLMLK